VTAAARTALTIFIPALAASTWTLGGGPAGWLYLLFYGLALLPGLPLGFALFGRGHAGGWIAGALIGYALTAFAIWAPIAAHVPSAFAFVAAWAAVAALAWFLAPRGAISTSSDAALVHLPMWTSSASTALLLVLVLTLAVAAPPLANVGRTDAAGNRYYRAYFTADFVWHTALAAEIAKYSMPPRNPYLSPSPIHYYWTYYLLPAALSESGPPPLRDVERCLKLNALMTGLLLMSAVFLAAWSAVGRAVPVALGTALALVASSAEGFYESYQLWSAGRPLSLLRDWNIDAVTAWPPFAGHRIDGLQRCLWYVPQHSMAYALGLIAMSVAAAAGSTASPAAIAITGLALGGSVAFNPLVGGIFALAFGLAVIVDALRRPAPIHTIARHAIAVVPVLAAIAWCYAGQMIEGAGGAVQFGLLGASRQAPLTTLLLSLGPILLIGLAGLWPSRVVRLEPLIPGILLAALALFLMYFVRLSVDTAWVAFRAGQMMLVVLAALAARFIAVSWEGGRRALAAGAVAVCLAAGLPTTVIDEFNAQDITNLAMGPGFPWTIVVTPDQQAAYRWIREHVPPTAVVQMDPAARDRSTWSNIPSFAERRMAAGLPISLLKVPAYQERSDRVRAMYDAADPAEAARLALSLRIDYVYVDEVERLAHSGAAQFDAGTQYFEPVFRRGEVGVYRVK
jgi:hypothetical protein